ncbi:TadE-like protein [Salinihabitans flavidus]|uniref:TadE-like protein n=1 Tax=Salinihabitans flavidus TaxID=569882 RepID=A0A1H8P326_9RHOB|nr:pilus assembly protein [Salinihabitans flavidus]SEO36018.1 TadE-like protein [Salinihabitans flavidus]
MTHSIFRRFRRFWPNDRGSVSVEAVIILPILLWAYMGSFIFFDMYRANSTASKAAYTISDMLSRETQAINQTYLNNSLDLFRFLSGTQDDESGTALRVSLISWDGEEQRHELHWSHIAGTKSALEDKDIDALADDLPDMANGEALILVETFATFTPSMNVGVSELDLETFIFTRPRFAPQLVWSGS